MYKIKQTPKDFKVREIGLDLKPGNTYLHKLWKQNLNTHEAVVIISKRFNIDFKQIGFAGLKDRNAQTEQFITLPKKIELAEDNLKLEFVDKTEKLAPGMLKGNEFEITIRNIEKTPKKIRTFVNYFDDQRFSKNNVEIGRAIVKKDFTKAVKLLEEANHRFTGDIKDPVGKLKTIHKRMLKLYVNSYQSYIWNESVSEYIKKNFKNDKIKYVFGELNITDQMVKIEIPLPGFSYPSPLLDKQMRKEKITYRDFIIKQLPSVTEEGSERKIIQKVKLEFSELEEDELNKGMKKICVKFELPKGSYATMVIKHLF